MIEATVHIPKAEAKLPTPKLGRRNSRKGKGTENICLPLPATQLSDQIANTVLMRLNSSSGEMRAGNAKGFDPELRPKTPFSSPEYENREPSAIRRRSAKPKFMQTATRTTKTRTHTAETRRRKLEFEECKTHRRGEGGRGGRDPFGEHHVTTFAQGHTQNGGPAKQHIITRSSTRTPPGLTHLTRSTTQRTL